MLDEYTTLQGLICARLEKLSIPSPNKFLVYVMKPPQRVDMRYQADITCNNPKIYKDEIEAIVDTKMDGKKVADYEIQRGFYSTLILVWWF
jgi:hypothetical protein